MSPALWLWQCAHSFCSTTIILCPPLPSGAPLLSVVSMLTVKAEEVHLLAQVLGPIPPALLSGLEDFKQRVLQECAEDSSHTADPVSINHCY